MTTNSNKKSKIIFFAMVSATLGMGTISLFFIPVAQSITKLLPSNGSVEDLAQRGFLISIIIFVVLATIMYQFAGFFTKERIRTTTYKNTSLRESIKTMWNVKSYRSIILSALLRSPADTATTTLTLFIVYYFGNNGNSSYIMYMIIFLLSMGVGQVSATFIAPSLTRRFERKKLLIFCLIGAAIPTASLFALFISNPNTLNSLFAVITIAVLLFATGSFCGIINLVQSHMVADSVDFAELSTGKRLDGAFFSGLTMLNKISIGVTALITGLVFAFFGFSGEGVRVVNEALQSGASFRMDEIFGPYRFAMFF